MGRGNARREAMLRPPPDAVEAPCAAFGRCGGCALQELPLARQEALRLALHLPAAIGGGPRPTVHAMRGARRSYGYRNRVEFSFGSRRWRTDDEVAAGTPDEGRWLGLHAPGRFDRIVDLDDCPIAHPSLGSALRAVRTVIATSPLPAWDPHAGAGFWRHLGVRCAESTGAVLVSVHTTSMAGGDAEVARLWAALPGMAGLTWHVFDRVADAALGPVVRVFGSDHIVETLGGVRFRLGPRTFFQTTTAGAEVLLDTVRDALGAPGHRLVDLYCGAGALGLPLAGPYASLLGIEEVAEAVADARRTAAEAGLDHARFEVGRVEDRPLDLDGADLIVDPPRAGLHPRAAAAIATATARVLVLVACQPATIGRDRAVLEAGGWRLTDLYPVDLFPQTGHLEMVARFDRGGP